MAFGEFVDHNWGAVVEHDDNHRDELAAMPYHERSLLSRDYSPESFDDAAQERRALQAVLGKVGAANEGAVDA